MKWSLIATTLLNQLTTGTVDPTQLTDEQKALVFYSGSYVDCLLHQKRYFNPDKTSVFNHDFAGLPELVTS